jgi:hypothetical protein
MLTHQETNEWSKTRKSYKRTLHNINRKLKNCFIAQNFLNMKESSKAPLRWVKKLYGQKGFLTLSGGRNCTPELQDLQWATRWVDGMNWEGCEGESRGTISERMHSLQQSKSRLPTQELAQIAQAPSEDSIHPCPSRLVWIAQGTFSPAFFSESTHC